MARPLFSQPSESNTATSRVADVDNPRRKFIIHKNSGHKTHSRNVVNRNEQKFFEYDHNPWKKSSLTGRFVRSLRARVKNIVSHASRRSKRYCRNSEDPHLEADNFQEMIAEEPRNPWDIFDLPEEAREKLNGTRLSGLDVALNTASQTEKYLSILQASATALYNTTSFLLCPSSNGLSSLVPTKPSKTPQTILSVSYQYPRMAELLSFLGYNVSSSRGLWKSMDLDVVFVAVDCEWVHYDREKPAVREIGFARLDTRKLDAKKQCDSSDMISAGQVSRAPWDRSKPCVFGPSTHVSQWVPKQILQDAIQISDIKSPGSQSLRKIVLVGHDIQGDLNSLYELGFDVKDYPSIVGVIDTLKIAEERFGQKSNCCHEDSIRGKHPFILQNLLTRFLKLKMSGVFYHSAGNDAVFALKAMSGLAARHLQREPILDEDSRQRTLRLGDFSQFAPGPDVMNNWMVLALKNRRIMMESVKQHSAAPQSSPAVPGVVSKNRPKRNRNSGSPRKLHDSKQESVVTKKPSAPSKSLIKRSPKQYLVIPPLKAHLPLLALTHKSRFHATLEWRDHHRPAPRVLPLLETSWQNRLMKTYKWMDIERTKRTRHQVAAVVDKVKQVGQRPIFEMAAYIWQDFWD